MSWVADVLILCSIEEASFSTDARGFPVASTEDPAPVQELNQWLAKRDLGKLDNINRHLLGGGKAFQSLVFGAAINRLPIEDFLTFARERAWENPHAVQILTKDENEEAFTMHAMVTA